MGIKKIHIEEQQVGAGLSLQEWANLVHPQSDGYVTVATKDASGEWSEKSYPSSMWLHKLVRHKELSCYVSVNSFFIPKRLNDNARHINAFYVDLDYYKESLSRDEVLKYIDYLVITGYLPEPTLIIDSGRGLYAVWLIESVPGKFTRVQKLYSHIEKHLIDVLKDVGSDPQASDVARVLKAPSTYHHITGKVVEVLKYKESHYTMRYLQQWFNEAEQTGYDAEKIRQREATKAPATKGKLKRLYNFYTLAIARASDLAKLCELRAYDLSGHRNTLIHIYAYQLFLIHNNYYVVRSKVVELNDKLTDPIEAPNLTAVIKSCLRAYERHREDVLKGYNYKTATIVKKLKITVDEQQHMKNLIGKDIKYDRKNVKRREDRRQDGLTQRERAKQEKIAQVKELYAQGLKQTEIASKLNIGKGTVSKYLKL